MIVTGLGPMLVVPAQAAPSYFYFEAESGVLTDPMKTATDAAASGSSYIAVPVGTGYQSVQDSLGTATFTISVPVSGNYVIWGRAIAPDSKHDTFWMTVDDTTSFWNVGYGRDWHWVKDETYYLNAGTHTVQVRWREDGTKLDKLLITNDVTFIPTGTGSVVVPTVTPTPTPTSIPSVTPTPTVTPTSTATPAPVAEDATIWIEAETATLASPMQKSVDSIASGGAYILVPENKGYQAATGTSGTATFQVQLSQEGDYTIWGRAIGKDGGHDSFWMSVDGATPTLWDLSEGGYLTSWGWAIEQTHHLTAGAHTIVVKWRENGVKLDKLVLTTSPGFTPTGMGGSGTGSSSPVTTPTPAVPTPTPTVTPGSGTTTPAVPNAVGEIELFIEAESGTLVAPMQQSSDALASGGKYILVPTGSGVGGVSGSTGTATYQLTIPVEDDYRIWGLGIAASGTHDSFWASVDGATPTLWDLAAGGYLTSWGWAPEGIHHFTAGTHTLEIKWREDGTQLDRLFITTDLGYEPEDPAAPAGSTPVPTATPVPTVTPVATTTPVATVTPIPSVTPVTTITPVATLTPATSGSETFGAESNPTGNPIGGGVGYTNVVQKTDPRVKYVVSTKSQLLSALQSAKSGEVVFIEGTANIDISGTYGIKIPAGVTLASDRGYQGSAGGRLYQTRLSSEKYTTGYFKYALIAGGNNVRITGIRLEGPDKTTDNSLDMTLTREGIVNLDGYHNLEVDNCELYGWSWAAIFMEETATADLVGGGYIHHNYIHHNQRTGLGYGVDLDAGSTALIEANLFDYNRHCIAAEGNANDGYEARYNIILANSPAWWSHRFDMHADPSSSGSTRPAGNIVLIHHNTFMGAFQSDPQNSYGIGIQGVPRSGAKIDHNWFYATASSSSSPQGVYTENNPSAKGITITQNIVGKDKVLKASGPVCIM